MNLQVPDKMLKFQENRAAATFLPAKVEEPKAKSVFVRKSTSKYHKHPEWNPTNVMFKARPVPKCTFNWTDRPIKRKTLHVTQFKPFSFYERDKDIEKRKNDRLEKIFEEEKKLRQYRARPVPSWLYRYTISSPDIEHIKNDLRRSKKLASFSLLINDDQIKNDNETTVESILEIPINTVEKKSSKKAMLLPSKASQNIELPIKGMPKRSAISCPRAPVSNMGTVKGKTEEVKKPVENKVPQQKRKGKPPKDNSLQEVRKVERKPLKNESGMKNTNYTKPEIRIQNCSITKKSASNHLVKPTEQKKKSPKDKKVQNVIHTKEYSLSDSATIPLNEEIVDPRKILVTKKSSVNLKSKKVDSKVDIKIENKSIDYKMLLEKFSIMQKSLLQNQTLKQEETLAATEREKSTKPEVKDTLATTQREKPTKPEVKDTLAATQREKSTKAEVKDGQVEIYE